MGRKINSLTIALKEDLDEENIETIIDMLHQFKFVADVKSNVTDPLTFAIKSQIKHEIKLKILTQFNDIFA